jgi:DNA-binding beta-propeller fold protein YncE
MSAWQNKSVLVAFGVTVVSGCSSGSYPPAGQTLSAARHLQACPCIYVTNLGDHHNGNVHSVTVYPVGLQNGKPPIQFINGAYTSLTYPEDIAVDASGNMYVADGGSRKQPASIFVYAAGATGNAAPIQTIRGPSTQLSGPIGIAISPLNGNVYVANQVSNAITIYPALANGNAAPIGTIGGSSTNLSQPVRLRFDSAGNLYVPQSPYASQSSAILVFAAGTIGNVAPIQHIQGDETQLKYTTAVATDASLNIYAANEENFGSNNLDGAVTIYSAGATGNVSPVRRIGGLNTLLEHCDGIGLDAAGEIIVANQDRNEITVYAAGASGNVLPIRHIRGVNTHLGIIKGLAVR